MCANPESGFKMRLMTWRELSMIPYRGGEGAHERGDAGGVVTAM